MIRQAITSHDDHGAPRDRPPLATGSDPVEVDASSPLTVTFREGWGMTPCECHSCETVGLGPSCSP